jgi:hypothetical protein
MKNAERRSRQRSQPRAWVISGSSVGHIPRCPWSALAAPPTSEPSYGCPPFPSHFASFSSLRRPSRREGSASARAGAPARRPADPPTALTDGLGNPGPTVQSRDCPSLLIDECSGRSCRFVVAGAACVAGVLLGKRSGSGPAGVRGGSRIALCLQGVSAAFRIRRSLGCGCGVVTPDRIMLAVERAGLAQAEAAALFGCRRRGIGRPEWGSIPPAW